MNKIVLFLMLVFLSTSVHAKKFDPPSIEIGKAIEIAKKYVSDNNIFVDEKYHILKVEFKNLYNEFEDAHWKIRWERLPRVKGGWLEIEIYNDGRINPVYGE